MIRIQRPAVRQADGGTVDRTVTAYAQVPYHTSSITTLFCMRFRYPARTALEPTLLRSFPINSPNLQ